MKTILSRLRRVGRVLRGPPRRLRTCVDGPRGTRPTLRAFAAIAVLCCGYAAAAQPGADVDRKLFEPDATTPPQAGPVAVPQGDHPLLSIARRMQSAQQRMAGGDCGAQTQQAQQETIAELDRLIAQAISQAHASGGGKKSASLAGQQQGGRQSKPSGEQTRSTPTGKAGQGRGGPNGGAPLGAAQVRSVIEQVWGELPEQARQQLLNQWSAEQFLPEYAPMIEQYFRRLSEAEEEKR